MEELDPYLELEMEQELEMEIWVATQAERCYQAYFKFHGRYPDLDTVIRILDYRKCYDSVIRTSIENIQKTPQP
ncbi:hypothetical protein IAQ67_28525 (plasmid) [Paenibacillus peoriae]|uniref:Uncharacterized protein n=1 Tax=Paenibacillus peoriae TaxID=59893 RepID=A0A7H0YHA1_9BACL|nr:hypothetical protein IAQ67_28525 [Paenibacillus peoriae]